MFFAVWTVSGHIVQGVCPSKYDNTRVPLCCSSAHAYHCVVLAHTQSLPADVYILSRRTDRRR